MSSNKPQVVFQQVLSPVRVGMPAVVQVADGHRHHTLGKVELARYNNVVTTSLVQEVNEDGSFETLNTLYMPLQEGKQDSFQ